MNYCFPKGNLIIRTTVGGRGSPSCAERTYTDRPSKLPAKYKSHIAPLPPSSSLSGQDLNSINLLAFSLLVLRPCPRCDYLFGNKIFKDDIAVFFFFFFRILFASLYARDDVYGPRLLTVSCLIFLLTETSFLLSATTSSTPSLPTDTIQA
jgi:hypothetical protein